MRSFTVLPHNLDARWLIKPESLCHLALDVAGEHAHELGLSVGKLGNEGLTWMLSRFKITMDSLPKGGEKLVVKTWPSGIEKLFAYRNFELTDGGGSVIGTAVSSWLMIDRAKRRPVRPQPHFEHLDITHMSSGGHESLEKIPGIENGENDSLIERRFDVLNRDIDMNSHVTSVSYISWLLETVPHACHTEHIIREIEVNYLAETFYGETVTANTVPDHSGSEECAFRHILLHAGNGRELVHARTVWDIQRS